MQLRTRAFETHAARTFLKKAPLRPVSDAALAELRQAIEVFFLKHNRPAGCQVFAYQRGHEHWFMIRRGDRFRRIATLTSEGSSDSTGYYAEAFDVVVLDPEAEHLHIHAEGVRATRMYGALFGFVLYGRDTHFEDCGRFTLEPLRELGRAALACADVPAITAVQLIELHLESGTSVVSKTSFKADDVFSLLEDEAIQLTPQHRRLRAVFLVHFKGDPKPRRVTIKPPIARGSAHWGR